MCVFRADVALSAITLLGFVSGNSYRIGAFTSKAHGVSGDLEALGPTTLRVKNFNYDGLGPDAYFWVGTTGNIPDETGDIVPVLGKGTDILEAYNGVDVVLTLPNALKVGQIRWLSVWCRQFKANFGDIIIPPDADLANKIPQPVEVGPLFQLAHDVSSGIIIIVDTRTFEIPNLKYDGLGPDAFFLVGTGSPDSSGIKIPDENGGSEKLKKYQGKSITIHLPENLAMKDIDYLSIYCLQATQNFGSVQIPADPFVPLNVEQAGLGILPHCEQMDARLNVAWKLEGNMMYMELAGALEPTEYMAFGMSGSDTRSAMIGAQVVVATVVEQAPKADDYKLSAYSLCAGIQGACPVTNLGESNMAQVLSSSVKNGVTRVRIQRPKWRTDTNDLSVVWAIGPYNANTNLATKHSIRSPAFKKLDLGRTGRTSCPALTVKEKPKLPAWPALSIPDYPKDGIFHVTIGPAGGDRGYTAITGQQSWGIAWYVNGLLIPEITVMRGKKYTFRVSGGDDPSNSAEYHPFYLTDSAAGGKNDGTTSETIYQLTDGSGAQVDKGTGPSCDWVLPSDVNPDDYDSFEVFRTTLKKECKSGAVREYSWTPGPSTPDHIYYQGLAASLPKLLNQHTH